jgi:thioredoxin 1
LEDESRSKKLQQLLKGSQTNGEAAPGKPQNLNQTQYEQILAKYPIIVIDFWAQRCQPCKVMAPLMDQLATEYQNKVFFGKVNTDENIDLANKLGIRNIPAFRVYKNRQLVEKAEGIVPKAQFKSMIDRHL